MRHSLLSIPILLIIFTFHFKNAEAQTISGTIKDEKEAPLPFVNIVAYHLPDTTYITGTTSDEKGYFEITNLQNAKESCLLKFSYIGYETQYYTASSDVSTVILHEKVNALSEVVIKADKPMIEQKEGRLIVNINGTALSKAGTLFDALKRSPGLLVDDDDNITVFGKGTPIVFLNGREVKNNAELATLQSEDIISIEIDRHPSAEYSASGNAVVRIKTKKITQDKLNFQLYNYSYMARLYRNKTGVNINGKKGNTSFTANYKFSTMNYKNYENSYEINKQPEYTQTNRNVATKHPEVDIHDVFASVNHDFNTKHTLGFQLTLNRKNSHGSSTSDQTLSRTDTATVYKDINEHYTGQHDLTTYNLYYTFHLNPESDLAIMGDYSNVVSDDQTFIKEHFKTDDSLIYTKLESNNDFEILSAKIDYNTRLNSVKFITGAKYSEVHKDGKTVSTNMVSNSNNYTNINTIQDNIMAAYTKTNTTIGKYALGIGLRYERTSTNVTNSKETVVDSVYHNWFPSIAISKTFSKNASLSLSYVKKIDRPSFNELSTDVIYFDANSYSIGNPKIKATIRNSVNIDLSLYKCIALNAGYKKEKNARILSAVNDDNDPTIIKYTPININEAQYIFANIDYTLSKNWYATTISLGYQKPHMDIPFLSETKEISKSYYFFKIDNNITLSDKVNFFVDLVYKSDEADLTTYYDRRYNLYFGCNSSFWNDKLTASLLVNDVLNTSDTSWEDHYKNIISGLNPDFDNSWVRLILKYNFNHFKKGIERKTSAEEELNRL